MAQFNPEQETNRLLRQSWSGEGGVNMLAREIASLFDVFFRTQTIGGNSARLDRQQTFTQPNTFASQVFVAYAGSQNALDVTHTGSAGFSLKVFGRDAAFYHGILLGQQNAALNTGYSLDIQHNQSTAAMRILHGGASGFCLQTAGKPCISYDGYIFTQQVAGNYSLQVSHTVSGTAVAIAHTLGGLALAVTGSVLVTGNLTMTGTCTAHAYATV